MTHEREPKVSVGDGGELHQPATNEAQRLTTNQGVPVSDDQSSLRVGPRGPTLLEDFHFREKITHFDHERIPERVVHARGYGAHGHFQPYESHADLTRAAFLSDPKEKTPVFVRFSTVAGSQGSADTARDVRGFAVKFYTREGVFDLVGNNIPVFFIQDALKFPDLIHAAKPEQDRGFPQAQTAHDTFWDFVSLMPESMHMLMWIMSDRAIPRSFRTMEGFGVHTFRMIDANGKSTFVKFHWRPKNGSFSLVWDEAVKIAGADPDFHRRDLWEAIESGSFPEWELAVQAFDQETADGFGFDILDATKLIPEEKVPLRKLGKLVLDRNAEEFFAETEQVAFCPSHIVPGIDFSDDPLLQGRLFSYLDTQLKRLGGPNFHEIPINKPRCPFRNLQRGGHMRMEVGTGRGAHEPSALDPDGPRESPDAGFRSHGAVEGGDKVRLRAESFADHYTQARLFWRSMTNPEQRHIVNAFTFELGKVTKAIRARMTAHLRIVDEDLGERVAKGLGLHGETTRIDPKVRPKQDVEPSFALSLLSKAPETLAGRKIGMLVTEGLDPGWVDDVRQAVEREGARLEIVAPGVGGVISGRGDVIDADHALAGAPSVLFDAVILAATEGGVRGIAAVPAAIDWVRDAYRHLKAIGFVEGAALLLETAGLGAAAKPEREGVVPIDRVGIEAFVASAKKHRIWSREMENGSFG